jgi:hypothetical protein
MADRDCPPVDRMDGNCTLVCEESGDHDQALLPHVEESNIYAIVCVELLCILKPVKSRTCIC